MEASMTFKFRIWPFGSGAEKVRWAPIEKTLRTRPVLVSKWQRARDGFIERRWEKKDA
jgi:hypothetical protein